MKKINYNTERDPMNPHICLHCKHIAYDIERGAICLIDGEQVQIMLVNDCEQWMTSRLKDENL